jgi:hypothetical protein
MSPVLLIFSLFFRYGLMLTLPRLISDINPPPSVSHIARITGKNPHAWPRIVHFKFIKIIICNPFKKHFKMKFLKRNFKISINTENSENMCCGLFIKCILFDENSLRLFSNTCYHVKLGFSSIHLYNTSQTTIFITRLQASCG